MTAVELQKPKPFWERHLGALLVGGFALLVAVIVALQILEEGDIARWLRAVSEEWAYALCFFLVWFDAVVPIFPGETTLTAASTLAAEGGDLELGLVMAAGALGAIIGDSSLFWIARKNADRVRSQLDRALENPKLRAGWDALDRSPGLLIVAGRYVPGMRFAVNASMGLSDIPTGASCPGRSSAGFSGRSTRAPWPTRSQRPFGLSDCIVGHLVADHIRRTDGDLFRGSAKKATGTGGVDWCTHRVGDRVDCPRHVTSEEPAGRTGADSRESARDRRPRRRVLFLVERRLGSLRCRRRRGRSGSSAITAAGGDGGSDQREDEQRARGDRIGRQAVLEDRVRCIARLGCARGVTDEPDADDRDDAEDDPHSGAVGEHLRKRRARTPRAARRAHPSRAMTGRRPPPRSPQRLDPAQSDPRSRAQLQRPVPASSRE